MERSARMRDQGGIGAIAGTPNDTGRDSGTIYRWRSGMMKYLCKCDKFLNQIKSFWYINYRVCNDVTQWIPRWWCTSSARMVPPNYDTRISNNSWRTCSMKCWSWSSTSSARVTTQSTNWISRKSYCATRISNPTSKLINCDGSKIDIVMIKARCTPDNIVIFEKCKHFNDASIESEYLNHSIFCIFDIFISVYSLFR